MSSVKINFGYNIVLTLTVYILQLLVFPYVSRVLGVVNIGKLGFVENVCAYFSLLSLLGVVSVGVIEIAACGDDREKRSQVFSSIICFILLTTLICILILIGCLFCIPKFFGYRDLFVIGITIIMFSTLSIEWFFQGIENFRYITIRSVAIRLLYSLCVFLFVKKSDDYVIYYALSAAVTVCSAAVNITYSRKFVDFSFKKVSLFKYAKPIFSLGVYRLTISMYTTFNVIFLGFVCSDIQVGFYQTSNKVLTIIMGVLAAFTNVMLPRMSFLVSSNQKDEFIRKIKDSFELIMTFAFPLAIGGVILAPQVIGSLAGAGYEGAVLPMQIIMPVIILSGLAQVWTIQVLLPLKKDKIVLNAAIIGAFVGVSLNILLIKQLGAVGSALVLLGSELCGNSYSLIYAIRYKYIVFPKKSFLKNLIGSIPYALICFLASFIPLSSVMVIIIAMAMCGIYFLFFQWFIMKNTYTSNYLHQILLIKR